MVVRRDGDNVNLSWMAHHRANLRVGSGVPDWDRYVVGGCDEYTVAFRGNALGILHAFLAEEGPLRQYCLGGHIRVVDVAVEGSCKEVPATTDQAREEFADVVG